MVKLIPSSSGGRGGCCHGPCSFISTAVAAAPLAKRGSLGPSRRPSLVRRNWHVLYDITPHMSINLAAYFCLQFVACSVAAWQHSSTKRVPAAAAAAVWFGLRSTNQHRCALLWQAMTWLHLRLSATLFVVQGRQSSLLGVKAFASPAGGRVVRGASYFSDRAARHSRRNTAAVSAMAMSTSATQGGEGRGGGGATGSSKGNLLAGETSPYLLQHAHNPVDWMPWGEEAFRKAKEEDKPIFLSIGYSTCHW